MSGADPWPEAHAALTNGSCDLTKGVVRIVYDGTTFWIYVNGILDSELHDITIEQAWLQVCKTLCSYKCGDTPSDASDAGSVEVKESTHGEEEASGEEGHEQDAEQDAEQDEDDGEDSASEEDEEGENEVPNPDEDLSPYEIQKLKNMEDNKKKLISLGLESEEPPRTKPKPRPKPKPKPKEFQQPQRQSSRLDKKPRLDYSGAGHSRGDAHDDPDASDSGGSGDEEEEEDEEEDEDEDEDEEEDEEEEKVVLVSGKRKRAVPCSRKAARPQDRSVGTASARTQHGTNLCQSMSEDTTVFRSDDVPCPFLMQSLMTGTEGQASLIRKYQASLQLFDAKDHRDTWDTMEIDNEQYICYSIFSTATLSVAVHKNASNDLLNVLLLPAAMLEIAHARPEFCKNVFERLKKVLVTMDSCEYSQLLSEHKELCAQLNVAMKVKRAVDAKLSTLPAVPKDEEAVGNKELLNDQMDDATRKVEDMKEALKLLINKEQKCADALHAMVPSKWIDVQTLLKELYLLRAPPHGS